MAPVADRIDVLGSFRFVVEIKGLQVAGFSDVSGLEAETEFEEYGEGGVNDYVHRFPKRTKYPKLVLKRGMTNSSALWTWYADVISGKIVRQDGSIVLQDRTGKVVCRWNFFGAYPVKWSGPSFNAKNSEVAIESMELVHNGWKAIFS